MPEESQIESYEHQDYADVRCQPFPEPVSEEQEIYTDYDGYHRRDVKHYSDMSAHFSLHGPYGRARNVFYGKLPPSRVSIEISLWLNGVPPSSQTPS
jgi:hypothetical protein